MSKPWVKLYVEMLDNPKVATLPLATRGVWMIALLVAERFDQEGLLPDAARFALMAHMDEEVVTKAMRVLVAKKLLDSTDAGLKIHDWLEWQVVEDWNTREAWRERKQRQRAKERMSRDVTRDIVTHRDTSHVTHTELKESESEREKREEQSIPAVSLALAPIGAKMTTQQSVIAALMLANGSDPTQALTKGEGARYGKAAAEIIAAGGTSADVAQRASNYAARFPDAPCTPSALAAHWGECATTPAITKHGKVLTKGAAIEQRTIQGVEDFRRMRKGSTDAASTVRADDDRSGSRLRSGRERPATERLLRPPAKSS